MKKLQSGLLLFITVFFIVSCSSKQVILIDDYQYKKKSQLTVYLVRHAEAYKNIPEELRPLNLPKGKLDTLTPKGEVQAISLGDFFKAKKLAAVIASPTGRTRQTAEAISKACPQPSSVLIYPEFKSLKSGITFDGKIADWAWRTDQWKNGNDPRPDGGENLAEGTKRALSAIDVLLKEYTNQAIVIVSHGDIIATLIGEAAQTDLLKRCERHMVEKGSVSELHFNSDQSWKLVSQSQIIQ